MRPHNTRNLLTVVGLLFASVLLSLLYPSLSGAGGIRDLGTLGGTDSVAYAVRSDGNVVGSAYTLTGATHAFLYADGIMTDLGTLPGGNGSEAYAINNEGQIVGASYVSSGDITPPSHAFLYSGGTMTDLGTLPGMTDSAAYGINGQGQIVGASSISLDITSTSHAFLYSGGTMTDLGTLPGMTDSAAYGINGQGQIVGASYIYPGADAYRCRAFLYSGGTMTDLGTLGGKKSIAYAINKTGQIVGTSSTSPDITSTSHAFLYSGGTMTDLGTLGGPNSQATAVNDAGQVVGWSDTASGESHAFLYSGGKMKDLGTLRGGHVSIANSINDAGQIAGWSLNSSGLFRAVLYPSGSPSIFARPSFLNFGPVKKGGDRVKEITLTNRGPGNLIFDTITLTGPDGTQFSAVHNCESPLIQGNSCKVTVNFQPTSCGPKAASLTIASNDPRKSSYVIDLKGDCPYPRMVLTPALLNFGETAQNQTSRVKVVTISNTSVSDLSISAIKLSDDVSFARIDSDSCSTVVRGGAPCVVRLTFTPRTSGTTAGVLTVSSDDRKGSASVKLYGRGK